MYAYKLQAGAIMCSLYFIVAYVRSVAPGKRTLGDRLFAYILFMSPIAIFFDGATAVTVNMLDTVPAWVKLLLHALFFITMDSIIIVLFAFIAYQTVGIKTMKHLWFIMAPGLVTSALVIYFIKDLYYIHGVTTNYSMGLSVYISYAVMIFYFIFICLLFAFKHRTLAKTKVKGVVFLMAFLGTMLTIQVVFPESLITSLLPIAATTVLYINFEDPALVELRHYNEEMITGFSALVESRDALTGDHIKHTRGYVEILLNEMKNNPRYKKILTQDYIDNVLNAAPMHDIGKIAIPDKILQKPARLTPEEYSIMQTHTTVGSELLKETFADINDADYKRIAYDVAKYHHEKWNGMGYPEGLKEEQIPLPARIMAIADVFEATTAKRCYKEAFDIDTCFEIIKDGAGTDFDPELVRLFLNANEKIRRYYNSERGFAG